jgi:hypothetical protein
MTTARKAKGGGRTPASQAHLIGIVVGMITHRWAEVVSVAMLFGMSFWSAVVVVAAEAALKVAGRRPGRF